MHTRSSADARTLRLEARKLAELAAAGSSTRRWRLKAAGLGRAGKAPVGKPAVVPYPADPAAAAVAVAAAAAVAMDVEPAPSTDPLPAAGVGPDVMVAAAMLHRAVDAAGSSELGTSARVAGAVVAEAARSRSCSPEAASADVGGLTPEWYVSTGLTPEWSPREDRTEMAAAMAAAPATPCTSRCHSPRCRDDDDDDGDDFDSERTDDVVPKRTVSGAAATAGGSFVASVAAAVAATAAAAGVEYEPGTVENPIELDDSADEAGAAFVAWTDEDVDEVAIKTPSSAMTIGEPDSDSDDEDAGPIAVPVKTIVESDNGDDDDDDDDDDDTIDLNDPVQRAAFNAQQYAKA